MTHLTKAKSATVPKVHRYFATASMAYPCILFLLIYVEWLFAYYYLGHKPIPNIDDPRNLPFSQTVRFVTLVLFGTWVHASIVCLLLNTTLFVHATRMEVHVQRRVLVTVALWALFVAVIALDVGNVVYWWLD